VIVVFMSSMIDSGALPGHGHPYKICAADLDSVAGIVGGMPRRSKPLQKPVPGPLFAWVKRFSWLELAIFTALVFFWLAPGFPKETMIFGWAHGIGYVGLCLLIWATVLRHEAPYTLLGATLTPVGPLGSVIAIELIQRKGWGIARVPDPAAAESA
jgi:hypothetical protein